MAEQQQSGNRRSSGGTGGAGAGGGRGGYFRGRKSCPFSMPGAPKIDYKDVNLLRRFVSERGKVMPSRITAVSAKKQRELIKAIKQARFLALLPYVNERAGA
ncbi:MAG: 30S ribosomal protein S18 [Proteobacteria bacterium]|nr:30S ribosomal protein S18 [Pseudomonadota bacterium]